MLSLQFPRFSGVLRASFLLEKSDTSVIACGSINLNKLLKAFEQSRRGNYLPLASLQR